MAHRQAACMGVCVCVWSRQREMHVSEVEIFLIGILIEAIEWLPIGKWNSQLDKLSRTGSAHSNRQQQQQY